MATEIPRAIPALIPTLAIPGAGEVIVGGLTIATVGVLGWEAYNYLKERKRAKSDPYAVPDVNPGRDCNGKCKPCPEPPPPWKVAGNAHGSTSGFHWHWI